MASNDFDTDDEIPKSRASQMPTELIEQWNCEQETMRQKLIVNDMEEWQFTLNREQKIYQLNELDENVDVETFYKNRLRYIAGVDISYIKGNDNIACAGLVILDAADNLKIVYEDISFVNVTQPYVPGYLAFREVPCLEQKLNNLKATRPDIYPQCIFLDGNGLLHPRRFGVACHLGVYLDTPTLGIAKKLFHVDGLEKNDQFKIDIKEKLKKKGDYIELRSQQGNKELIGICYRTCAENPIYLSIGHKIGWKTCLLLVNLITTKYRIPEPTRLADLHTREYIRLNNKLNQSNTSINKSNKADSNDSDQD